ncbi:DNA repair protein rad10, partial [Ramicandelaber brevisporus]
TIVVNSNQRGNPLLKSITGIPWEYGDIVPDYQVGNTSCVLFLSLRYHQLHPDYIYSRITKLGSQFVLRILLCLIDADDHREVLKELSRACIAADLTLVCCWSNEEAGRWVESFKAYEFHSADQIKEKVDNNYLSRVTKSLTKIRSINKDNVATLLTTFGSFKNIANAPKDELEQCIGLGPQRVNRLMQAFNQPFTSNKSLRRNTQTQLMLTGTGLSIAPPSNQSGATSSKGDGEQTETRSKFF